jgi:poly-beta-1,6-N-acetyl-D-glucosamine N-deacetylase
MSLQAVPLWGRLSSAGRQALIGLLAIPLSTVPFLAYAKYTPQGSLLAARIHVAIAPPHLPVFTRSAVAGMRADAPRWSGRVAVLVYHGMGASTGEQSLSMPPEIFAEQIATLKASGMNPVTAADLADARAGRGVLPENAVMISFDDGRTDAFLWADPVLEEARWKATMFVITSEAADTSLYYESWGDIAKLAGTGRWDIESHSAGLHYMQTAQGGRVLPALTSLVPGESLTAYRSRVTRDLNASAATITKEVGRSPQAIAYPFGAYGAERTDDPRLRAVLAAAVSQRFTLGFEQDEQGSVPLAGCSGNPLLIRRLEVGDWSGRELMRRLARMAARPASSTARPCPTAR